MPVTNIGTPSTRWGYRRVKLAPAPQANSQRRPKGGTFFGIARRDSRDRLNVVVSYRGGSEAWWLVEARGRRQAFPGHWTLHDVLECVMGNP